MSVSWDCSPVLSNPPWVIYLLKCAPVALTSCEGREGESWGRGKVVMVVAGEALQLSNSHRSYACFATGEL